MNRQIIFSSSEPDKNSLWLHLVNGKLKLQGYGLNGWEDLTGGDSDSGSAFKYYTEAGGTKPEEDFKTSFVKSIDNPVLTSEQTLNDGQKAQARTNIGAASEAVIGDINSILDTINGEVI